MNNRILILNPSFISLAYTRYTLIKCIPSIHAVCTSSPIENRITYGPLKKGKRGKVSRW